MRILQEKSESKAQRRLMGWAKACKEGEASSCPSRIKKVGKGMSTKELRKFAKTKETGLPEKKHPEKDIRNESGAFLTFKQFLIGNSETV
jgi:hypothetical protein